MDSRPGIVPLVDVHGAARVYDPALLRLALLGAALAGTLLGLAAYGLAAGLWPIAGLGQFAAAGTAPATFVGAGVGLATGALAGALVALYRLPARRV